MVTTPMSLTAAIGGGCAAGTSDGLLDLLLVFPAAVATESTASMTSKPLLLSAAQDLQRGCLEAVPSHPRYDTVVDFNPGIDSIHDTLS